MPIHMQIQISDEANDALQILADRHHRSKRMEVLAALDHYIQSQKDRFVITSSTVPLNQGGGTQ